MLILCNGMIRSGSTIQYNLVQSLLEEAGVGTGMGFINDKQDDAADQYERLCTDSATTAAKAHHRISALDRYGVAGQVRVCATYRHPLDVAGSAKTKFGWPWPEILDKMQEGIEVHAWATGLDHAIVQRYESLVEDLPGATAELNEKLGLGLDQEAVRRIADSHTVEKATQTAEKLKATARKRAKLRSAFGRLGLLSAARALHHRLPAGLQLKPPVDAKTNLHHNHISAGGGQPGVSRQQLTQQERDDVVKRFGAWMARQGYETV
ncbi:MAG: hypothetical protein AAF086_03775 [Planctomycetota bacterium]